MTFIDFSEAMQIAAECRRWTLQCERLNWPKDLPETFSRPARSPKSPERCLENSRWGQQMLIVLDVFRGKPFCTPQAIPGQYPILIQTARLSTKAQLASGLDGQTMESMDHYVKTVVRCWPQGVLDSELTDEPWTFRGCDRKGWMMRQGPSMC